MNIFKIDSWVENRIVQNLFVWLCFGIIMLGAIQAENKLLAVFYSILLLAPAIYINNLIILPISRKKTGLFFLFFVINTLFFSIIAVYFISRSMEESFEWEMLLNFTGILVLALSFGSAVKMARDNFHRKQEEKEAELRLLKAQLNPHFLFNTLNNLYGLSVVKSDKLPSLMLKLSDLLRYSLYDTKEELVPLEKEVEYLENYTSLEKIRLEDKTQIQFAKSGNLATKAFAPMLLIVFVENAFKHLGTNKNGKSSVLIDIDVNEENLVFKCTNTIDEAMINLPKSAKKSGGIGLKNAKKRLKLMYAGQYQLEINKENGFYIVELKVLF